jgi:hypothetical protein
MSLPPPAVPQHRDDQDRALCTVAADDDRVAVTQWAYEITTEADATRLGEMIGVELLIGDTVPVFACDEHVPDELRPDPMDPVSEA